MRAGRFGEARPLRWVRRGLLKARPNDTVITRNDTAIRVITVSLAPLAPTRHGTSLDELPQPGEPPQDADTPYLRLTAMPEPVVAIAEEVLRAWVVETNVSPPRRSVRVHL